MAIIDNKITEAEIQEHYVEGEPDNPGGTPTENKQIFDDLPTFVINKLNGLIDDIVSDYIAASQISTGLSKDESNNVEWQYALQKAAVASVTFSGTVNYNTKTQIKAAALSFLDLRNAIVNINDTDYLMDDGVPATESYSEYDGKIRLSSDATKTYITILDEEFSTEIGTQLTVNIYTTSATTVPAKSLPLVVGEATGDYLQEQIDGVNTNIGDMALSTVATDLTGAINETHNVPLDIQELYKPLIAPLSVSLTGFVEGSYLYYGIPWDSELRIFVRVSKTTAMSGTTAIGTLPSGYRPAETQELNAYDEDGNIIADVIVAIGTDGAVSVIGNVEANVIVMAAYNSSSNSQSGGGLTYKDIDRLISQNGAVIKTNDAWPEFEADGSRYRKFADGRAEIDIQVSGTKACTTSGSAGWYTQSADTIMALPIVLTSIDMLTHTLFPATWGCMLRPFTTGFPTEIRYRLQHSASNAGINFTAHFRVLGRWK